MGGLLGWIPDLLGMDKDSPFRHLVGLVTMGVVGYGVYYGVKQLTSSASGDSAPAPSAGQGGNVVGESGGKKVYCNQTSSGERCVRSDGVRVEERNGAWVPVGGSSSIVISIDPTFTKGVDTRQAGTVNQPNQNPDEGHDVYQAAYDSFAKSKANGTLKVQTIADSNWAKRYTTEDGKVILKDTKGNLATKDSAGKWVITNPSGQYVATVGSKTRIQNVATTFTPQVSRL